MVCLEAADAVDLSRISMQSRPRRLRQALGTSKRRCATCKQRESQMKVVVVVVVVKGCTPALVFCSGSSNQLTPNSGKRLCHKQRKNRTLYLLLSHSNACNNADDNNSNFGSGMPPQDAIDSMVYELFEKSYPGTCCKIPIREFGYHLQATANGLQPTHLSQVQGISI